MSRPVMLPQAKSLKHLTQSEYIILVNKYLFMQVEELEDMAHDRFLPALDHIVIRIIVDAMRKGDVDKLEKLLERVIGKTTIKAKPVEIEAEREEAKPLKIEVIHSGVEIT